MLIKVVKLHLGLKHRSREQAGVYYMCMFSFHCPEGKASSLSYTLSVCHSLKRRLSALCVGER